jgi:chromosome segregation protein
MIRLTKITVDNFKSFAGKISIPFPEGFNTIAGPNGSGKSNVVDALVFILGTTSARSIRAQKLQSLIFNGAANRKPADYCEVSLYLDNSSGEIPGEDVEVKVTRRITRSGISIYKVNGRTYTRAKVLELLSRAKLSSDGFNIIMQGDVTKIIEMSPIERKGIIDEISGIAEFDDKKNKAERELERVESRVRENMIVISEKQALVQRLRSEKENAEKYQKLEGELRKSKASLAKKRFSNIEEKMSGLDKDIDEQSSKLEEIDKGFVEKEKEQEDLEKNIRSLTDDIIKKSRNYETSKKVDSIQSEILTKREKIDTNEREMIRFEGMTSHGISSISVKETLKSGISGIIGTLSSLIKIDAKYSTALEVAMGRKADDIVVENDDVAVKCIRFLKERKLGRARFLPLNKIRSKPVKEFNEDEGHMMELVKFDNQYFNAVAHVLGNTVVVSDIDNARRIKGFRVVTLDGDLVETSGAMLGGYYQKKKQGENYGVQIKKIEEENAALEEEIRAKQEKLDELKGEMNTESEEVTELQSRKTSLEAKLDNMKSGRGSLYDERTILQSNVGKLKIEKARMEATLDNIKLDVQEYKDVKGVYDETEEELNERVRQAQIEINTLGPVNMKAIEDYKTIAVEFETMKEKLDKLLEEKDSVVKVVQEVQKRRQNTFMEAFRDIARNFTRIYEDLTGGFGQLRLEEEENIDSGMVIEASLKGKKIINLDSMSGGEKTITSLAFLFGVMEHYGSPFYILDEVDAALDKVNTKRIVELVKKYSKNKQFIVISHNDFTIQESDKIFGVSMEDGVSKVFSLKMPGGSND